MKKSRNIILFYSSDQEKKKKEFVKEYNFVKKKFLERNVKLYIKKTKKRKQLFRITLYGYDNKIKYISNKISSLPLFIKKIDKMPLGKMERLKSIELYTNAHPESTTKGTGYKNRNSALKTLRLIKNKSKKYQFLVINTLYQRAKYHKHRTKKMEIAMKIYKKWLNEYKKKSMKGGDKKYKYLELELVNKYEKLAEYYNVSRKARGLEKPTTSDEGFLVVYRKMKGNGNKMKNIPCRKDKPEGVDWDRKRIVEVSGKMGQAKSMKLDLFHKSGKLKGLPTIIHINMIMWAYSPYENLLKKNIYLLKNL